jgi:hypothetical protein
MVKMSEAEKNLAWEAAEQAKRQQKELEKELGPGALMTAAAPLMPAPLPGMAGVAALAGMMAPAQPMVAAGPARLALSSLPTSIAGAGCIRSDVLLCAVLCYVCSAVRCCGHEAHHACHWTT